MKHLFHIVALLSCLLTESVAQTSDYFPLHIGAQFRYTFKRYQFDSFDEPLDPIPDTWTQSTGTGYVFYSILDSISQNDTLILWSIQERDSILFVDSSSSNQSDSYWSTGVSLHTLVESKYGNHRLTNNDMRLWCMTPYSNRTFYRYYLSSDDSIPVSMPYLVNGSSTYASCVLAKNVGLTSFSYYEWYGHITGVDILSIKSFLQSYTLQTVQNHAQNVDVFSLRQNYPNPFNPKTVIVFSLANESPTTLKVYDILGQEIITLVHGVQSPGPHSVVWDAMGCPSGIYFYRLQSGAYVQTKKLLFIK